MDHYIDGFTLPIPQKHINNYIKVAEEVGKIWKEYGAIEYKEFLGDDMLTAGTRSFLDGVNAKSDEVVIFGWVTFPSKEVRNRANREVPKDPRMTKLIAPLIEPGREIFDGKRMVYGGFTPLINL